MDQFSAHLDRGWDLVQKGDTRGAEGSARSALQIDEESPEAYNLLGYAAALEGDFEEALEHYEQALHLDDGYLEAMLNAAEICIHPLAHYDQAESLCDQALELAENSEERVDALLLKFDALLGGNDIDAARAVCRAFPDGPFENEGHTFLVGRALYEAGMVEDAYPLIERSIKAHPDNPEAQYYMGLLLDERGDSAGATQAFLRSRDLDLGVPAPPWSLTRETFQSTIQNIVSRVREDLQSFISPSEVFIADLPGVEVISDGVDPRSLLLLDAIAETEGKPSKARLFVHQRNVERLAGALELLTGEFKDALERELAAGFLDAGNESEETARSTRNRRVLN